MKPSEIPMLEEIFERLRRGEHICPEDGEVYRALDAHAAELAELFGGLGFRLVRHRADFFHFTAPERFSPTGARVAVFAFILVEWLAGRGETVERAVMEEPFAVEDLPHLESRRYRRFMADVDVADASGMDNLLRQLERLGFVRFVSDGVLRFRRPAYRLLDLCAEVARRSGGGE